ncbi:MAG: inverse autotransporter beta domain-containing protein [Chlamydiae bacterium]|nr:inverse autotransporter beta domain-containing protein [Chlamydiota bacterium]
MKRKDLLIATILSLIPISMHAARRGEEPECAKGPRRNSFEIGHREPGGIGYPDGYTSFRFFSAPTLTPSGTPFLDFRAHVNNAGKWAGNFGIGWRYFGESAAYGANFYWDFRNARHRFFQEIGFGFEALFPRWKVWANSYIPVGPRSRTYKISFDEFVGNQALFKRKRELSMYGIDAGAGVYLWREPRWNVELQGAGYYFQSVKRHKHAIGGLARLKIDLFDYVALEGQGSYDSLFKWNGYGEIALRLPIGGGLSRCRKRCLSCCDLIAMERRLTQRPDRFEMMPTTRRNTKTPAIDPITGEPLFFIFVDNTAGSDGTFESPFNTLLAAQNASKIGDIIYVFPGDGTSTGMNNGIILKNNQSLVGSGFALDVSTRFGENTIPPQTPGALPFISAAGATDAVEGADNVLIQGLRLTAASQVVSLVARRNGIVRYNQITGGSEGVFCQSSLGTVRIEHNVIRNTNNPGIRISSGMTNPLTIFIVDSNLVQTTTGTAIAIVDTLASDVTKLFITNNFNESRSDGTALNANLNGGVGTQMIQMFAHNNSFQTSVATYAVVNTETTGFTFVEMIGNFGDRDGGPANVYQFTDGGVTTNLELRLIRNEAAFNNLFQITSNGGVVNVQSTNLLLSGVEQLNTGMFTTSGGTADVTFVPLRAFQE